MRIFELKNEFDMLLAQAIDIETGEVVDEKALELFEAAEGALEQKAVAYGVVIKELWAKSEGIKSIEKGLAERRRAFDNRAALLEEALRTALPRGSKIVDPRVEIRVAKEPSQRTSIIDEAMLPEGYTEQKWVPLTDKIRKDLLAGIEVEGAQLVDGVIGLTIK